MRYVILFWAVLIIAAPSALALECADYDAAMVMDTANDIARHQRPPTDLRITDVTNIQFLRAPDGETICHARLVINDGTELAYTYRAVHEGGRSYLRGMGPLTPWR